MEVAGVEVMLLLEEEVRERIVREMMYRVHNNALLWYEDSNAGM